MSAAYVYWISTGLLVLLYTVSAVSYLAKPKWAGDEIAKLGYPRHLFWLLITVKLVAVAVLILRLTPALSDFVYAGIAFHMGLAVIAHFGEHKPKAAVPAFIALILVAASFATQNFVRSTPSSYAPSVAAHASTMETSS